MSGEKDGNYGETVDHDCGFCGHPRGKLYPQRVGSYRRTGTKWQVVCGKCRARGPLEATEEQAVLRWVSK